MTETTRRLAMRLTPILMFCIIFGVTLFESQSVKKLERESIKLHVEDQLASYERSLQLNYLKNIEYLNRIVEKLEQPDGFSYEAWAKNAASYLRDTEGLLVFDWVAPDYGINWTLPEDPGPGSDPTERPVLNEYLAYLDMQLRDGRLGSLSKFLDINNKTLSLYAPITSNGALAGWVGGVFSARDYFASSLKSFHDIDVLVTSNGEEIYRSLQSVPAEDHVSSAFILTSIGEENIQITATATAAFISHSTNGLSSLILAIGLAIASAVTWILHQYIELRTRESMLKVKDSELSETRGSLRKYDQAMTQAEISLEEAQRIANIGSWVRNLKTGEMSWSRQMYRIFEIDPESGPLTADELIATIHSEDRECFVSNIRRYISDGEPANFSARVVLGHGQTKYMRFMSLWVEHEHGEDNLRRGTVQDVTQQRVFEEQLRNAKNLQSIGQLTGGIAHDFNNILGVVSSTAQLIEMEHSEAPDVARNVKRINNAVGRGALLTDQLLSFSSKQRLTATDVDSCRFVKDIGKVIGRKFGTSIELVIDIDADLTTVHVDEDQLSNAILNLALNSRESIKDTGKVTLSATSFTADSSNPHQELGLEEGEYVVFSVSDTGSGLPQEALEKAFEPFFTTKDVGQGSGLGLSMVYGFAQQSGGHVSLHSELGKGTTVLLYLPAAVNTKGRRAKESPKKMPDRKMRLLSHQTVTHL